MNTQVNIAGRPRWMTGPDELPHRPEDVPLWNPQQLQARAWLDHQRIMQLFSNLPAGRELFLGRFDPGLNAEQNALINRVLPKAKQWAQKWANPTVVVHGAYRLDNMLFSTTARTTTDRD